MCKLSSRLENSYGVLHEIHGYCNIFYSELADDFNNRGAF